MELERLLAFGEEIRYTRRISSRAVALAGAVLIGLGGVWAVSQADINVPSLFNSETIFPEGFEDVELGMSPAEVKEERANTKGTRNLEEVLSKKDGKKIAKQIFGFDVMPHMFPSKVNYTFKENELVRVTFSTDYLLGTPNNYANHLFPKLKEGIYLKGKKPTFFRNKGDHFEFYTFEKVVIGKTGFGDEKLKPLFRYSLVLKDSMKPSHVQFLENYDPKKRGDLL